MLSAGACLHKVKFLNHIKATMKLRMAAPPNKTLELSSTCGVSRRLFLSACILGHQSRGRLVGRACSMRWPAIPFTEFPGQYTVTDCNRSGQSVGKVLVQHWQQRPKTSCPVYKCYNCSFTYMSPVWVSTITYLARLFLGHNSGAHRQHMEQSHRGLCMFLRADTHVHNQTTKLHHLIICKFKAGTWT